MVDEQETKYGSGWDVEYTIIRARMGGIGGLWRKLEMDEVDEM